MTASHPARTGRVITALRAQSPWAVAAVVVAFLVRLAWATAQTTAPVPSGSSELIGDWYSTWNLRMADQLGRGDMPSVGGIHTAYWSPGYSMVLAPFAWLSRVTGVISLEFAAALVNVVAGTVTVLAVGALAGRLASGRARTPALWLMAVAPGHVFATSTANNEPMIACACVASIWACTVVVPSAAGPGRVRRLMALGALLGFAVLVKDLLAVLLVVPALLTPRTSGWWRRSLRTTAWVLAGAALVLAPWAIRNGVQVGWWSPTATSSSEGLCAGTHPQGRAMSIDTTDGALLVVADDCLRGTPLDNPDLGVDAYLPEGWQFDRPDEARASRARTTRSLRRVVADPGDILSRVPLRLYEALGSDDTGGLDLATYYRRHEVAGPVATSVFQDLSNAWYYLVVGLALVSLATSRPARRAAEVWVPAAVVGLYPAIGPYGYSRHVFALYPLLVVLGAWALARLNADAGAGPEDARPYDRDAVLVPADEAPPP